MRGSTSKNVEGWTLDVKQGSVRSVDSLYSKNCRDDNSWYGYGALGGSGTDGSIKTTLNGYGKARLDFGNCYHSVTSYVQVNLNGNKIGKATGIEMSKKIEFYFNNGDILELRESSYASIRFNNFTVISCGKKNE